MYCICSSVSLTFTDSVQRPIVSNCVLIAVIRQEQQHTYGFDEMLKFSAADDGSINIRLLHAPSVGNLGHKLSGILGYLLDSLIDFSGSFCLRVDKALGSSIGFLASSLLAGVDGTG